MEGIAMRLLASVLVLALLSVPAAAQPWYARGSFNGWGTADQMVVDPGDATHYTANLTGFFDNEPYMWKIAVADWSVNMPNNDSRVYTNAAGELNFHLWDNTSWSDGWFPNNERRVGYQDHQQFDWEIVGSFNGWPGAPDANYALTDMGNGLHRGAFMLNAGIYDFKFRGLTATEWDTTIGNSFGNSAGNNSFAVTSNGDEWIFELDLPNGRWRAYTEAAPPGQAGDYNDNGTVDAADYVLWRKNENTSNPLANDPIGGTIGQAHYNQWRANFGMGAAATWLVHNTPIGAQTPLPDQQLTDLGGGQYDLQFTGLTPAEDYDFKVVRSDLSASLPGSNMRVRADAAGKIDLNFYELTAGSWGDGWSPANTHRLGYVDHQEFDWQLMGSFNGWTDDPAFDLTDQGNGLHTGAFTFDTPGPYQFKIRQRADWNTSIGDDFGNAANNNSFTVGAAGEVWNFELDLPNGRWRAYTGVGAGASLANVPEPSTIAIVLAGMLAAGLWRRQ
jgi:hypothetical protein